LNYSAFFDLEGPLSPQDNAYEVLALADNGRRVFEVLSRYDDVLTLEGRRDYEPGDTLKLIVPFLIYHGITERDIRRVSGRAKIVGEAREVIAELKERDWRVRIISTSYEQHAHNIGSKVGVSPENIACTRFPLDKYRASIDERDLSLIEEMEKGIIRDFSGLKEAEMVKRLDDFFFEQLPKTTLGKVFGDITVIGGQRKVEAMLDFIRRDEARIRGSMAIGDSITDYKMLRTVSDGGGLAIAFNGNEYSIPYADIGIASEDLGPLLTFADAFAKGGSSSARALARRMEKGNPTISYLANADEEKLGDVIKIHGEYRKKVRGEAGKLG
jgi:energy-converting hydrogenase A subunit R